MRLIDAEALYEYILRSVPNWSEDREVVLDCIANSPTIEERKRGKWIDGSDERFVKCSKCGMETTRNELQGIALFGQEEPNYCPNCGADMRGDDNAPT